MDWKADVYVVFVEQRWLATLDLQAWPILEFVRE